MRATLRLIELRRYEDVAVLVDPVALQVYRDRRIEEARRDEEQARLTRAEHVRVDPDFSLAIEDYFVQSEYHKDQRDHGQLLHTGGASLEELERMTPAQLLGSALRTLDPRNEPAGSGGTPLRQRRVIGEVINGNQAYVLYTSQFTDPPAPTNMAVLRLGRAGWCLLPHGELFGQSARPTTERQLEEKSTLPETLSVRQAPWTGRTFEHRMPIDLFPAMLERLRGTPARAAETIAAIPAQWRTVRMGGRWSIQEHLGHLLDLEELGEQRLREYQNRADFLSAADMTNRKTELARHNDRSVHELLERFRAERDRLVAQLVQLTPDTIAHQAVHPRLHRSMNVVEWLYFMCEHDDHHLARMREEYADLTAGSWTSQFRA